MNAMDRHARKQVLVTRIAFERAQLRSELAQLDQTARWPNLLRGAIGGSLGRSMFGAPGPATSAPSTDWVGLALTLLRRYRIAAALLGSAGAIVGGRGWRRIARVGGVAVAAFVGWRFVRGRRRSSDDPR